jgi:hypothetical protein
MIRSATFLPDFEQALACVGVVAALTLPQRSIGFHAGKARLLLPEHLPGGLVAVAVAKRKVGL